MPLKLLRATQSWPGHKVIFLMQCAVWSVSSPLAPAYVSKTMAYAGTGVPPVQKHVLVSRSEGSGHHRVEVVLASSEIVFET